jgi:hypothetical protein
VTNSNPQPIIKTKIRILAEAFRQAGFHVTPSQTVTGEGFIVSLRRPITFIEVETVMGDVVAAQKWEMPGGTEPLWVQLDLSVRKLNDHEIQVRQSSGSRELRPILID